MMKREICPRCRNEMILLTISERIEKTVKILYQYKCFVCKKSKIVEVVEVKRDTDRIIVTKSRINVS